MAPPSQTPLTVTGHARSTSGDAAARTASAPTKRTDRPERGRPYSVVPALGPCSATDGNGKNRARSSQTPSASATNSPRPVTRSPTSKTSSRTCIFLIVGNVSPGTRAALGTPHATSHGRRARQPTTTIGHPLNGTSVRSAHASLSRGVTTAASWRARSAADQCTTSVSRGQRPEECVSPAPGARRMARQPRVELHLARLKVGFR